jgi:hypothetical protein
MKTQWEYPMVPCKEYHFKPEELEEAKGLGMLGSYYCMNGTEIYLDQDNRVFSVIVDYCNQTFLDKMYPG